jgi:copper chaperone CopZ
MSTIIATYCVSGMTCSHCVAAVTEEVGGLDGVSAVEVDLTRIRG